MGLQDTPREATEGKLRPLEALVGWEGGGYLLEVSVSP